MRRDSTAGGGGVGNPLLQVAQYLIWLWRYYGILLIYQCVSITYKIRNPLALDEVSTTRRRSGTTHTIRSIRPRKPADALFLSSGSPLADKNCVLFLRIPCFIVTFSYLDMLVRYAWLTYQACAGRGQSRYLDILICVLIISGMQ